MRLFLPISGLVTVLLVVQLLLGNFVGAKGVDLAGFNSEILKLTEENQLLETEIFKASSLATVSALASQYGLEKAKTVYLSRDLPLAVKR